MKKNNEREEVKKIISPFVEQSFWEDWKEIMALDQWSSFSDSYKSLRKAASSGPLPFDPKFNSIIWAIDVAKLCQEIAFSYCWMNSYAKFYKKQVRPGTQPSDTDFHVSYFADNCIVRINSCRDKLALIVWAFYVPFNPEERKEVPDYQYIVKQLKHPKKLGLKIKNQNSFLTPLALLKGTDFKCVEKYRHFKIHRLEPRIELYGVNPHHDWPYMLPVVKEKDKENWEENLKSVYTDPLLYKIVKEGCYINGVLYDRDKIEDRLWSYEEIEKHIRSCLIKLVEASDGCFRTLRKRKPFRNNRRRIKRVVKR